LKSNLSNHESKQQQKSILETQKRLA